MRKESKILSISNSVVEKLSKADQAILKGGNGDIFAMGCPPPIEAKPV